MIVNSPLCAHLDIDSRNMETHIHLRDVRALLVSIEDNE